VGQKVNPINFRLGKHFDWQSKWFEKRNYSKLLLEDLKIRKYLEKKLASHYVSKIEISRNKNEMSITIFTARPGMIIGRSGATITALKNDLQKLTTATLSINIEEIKEPNLDAKIVAMNIAQQIEKRVAYKRAMKQAIAHVMEAGAMGVKVMCKGRLAGAEIARAESISEGSLPLGTLDADIDFGQVDAKTTYGIIGVKVWINRKKPLTKE